MPLSSRACDLTLIFCPDQQTNVGSVTVVVLQRITFCLLYRLFSIFLCHYICTVNQLSFFFLLTDFLLSVHITSTILDHHTQLGKRKSVDVQIEGTSTSYLCKQQAHSSYQYLSTYDQYQSLQRHFQISRLVFVIHLLHPVNNIHQAKIFHRTGKKPPS